MKFFQEASTCSLWGQIPDPQWSLQWLQGHSCSSMLCPGAAADPCRDTWGNYPPASGLLGLFLTSFPSATERFCPPLPRLSPGHHTVAMGLSCVTGTAGSAAQPVPGHLCPEYPVPALWNEECQQFTPTCPRLALFKRAFTVCL